jgi:predicted RNA binding protein YcfA (HicA-like mRNA interferase family)
MLLLCVCVCIKLLCQEKMMTSADLIKELKAAGCEPARNSGGSHRIWWSPDTGKTFPVPHPIKDLPIGTVRSIRKLAGI